MIISSSQHKLAKLYLRLCFGGRVAPIKCTARDNPVPVQRHVSSLKPTSIVRLPCRAVQHTYNGISHRVPERLYCSPDEHRFGAGTCPRMPLICILPCAIDRSPISLRLMFLYTAVQTLIVVAAVYTPATPSQSSAHPFTGHLSCGPPSSATITCHLGSHCCWRVGSQGFDISM